ncbi:dTDP-4-dehydrorhamnose reductase [Actinomadura sediminis]|uniref:dTDP-4-dehydrorhamnose reductase n=1 Tax=Actinomadura sediminis TaxID=1038904 RepID=A0ABW3ELI0_9ACTN
MTGAGEPGGRWLITGAGGVLGRELADVLRGAGREFAAPPRAELDVTDTAAVRAAVLRHRPRVLVNCAAWTRFHEAEAHEDDARRVNGDAVRGIAEVCAETGVRLVHVSTDYVFDGGARCPYAEDAPPAPLNAYGRTKLAGERAVADVLSDAGTIVRTAWLHSRYGTDFVSMMVEAERTRETVDAVDDERGQPTWAADAAHRIAALAARGATGVFHATNAGSATRHELAREVFRLLGADPDRVRPVDGGRFPGPGRRPRYTVLGHGAWERAGLPPMRHWRDALAAALPRSAGQAGRTAV